MRAALIAALILFPTCAAADEPARPCSDPGAELGAVVFRYVGETGKTLDRAFAASASTDASLTFDEADALFGRRSEVNDAHNRYANLETSYLLAHRGPQHALDGFPRRAFAVGFDRRQRARGAIVIEAASGVVTLDFTGATRGRAAALAREFARRCAR